MPRINWQANAEELVKKHPPTLSKLIELVLDYKRLVREEMERRDAHGSARFGKIADKARKQLINEAKTRIKRLEEDLGVAKGTLMYWGNEGLQEPTAYQKEVFNRIDRILLAYQELAAFCSEEKPPDRIRVATSELLSVRLLPPLLREYFGLLKNRSHSVHPEIDVTYGQPYQLVEWARNDPRFDLVLTYCSAEEEFKPGVKLAEASMRRCALVRMDLEGFAGLKGRLEAGELSFDQLLAELHGLRVAMLSNEHIIPDFPAWEIASAALVVPVRTTLEAHAHIRARSADITFTHKEVLSEGENKYLTVIDLSKVVGIGTSRLCLLRGRAPRKFNSDDPFGVLIETLVSHLERIDGLHAESEDLTGQLRRFGTSYHTSLVSGTRGRKPTVKWFLGHLDLEAKLPLVSSSDRKVWFVKGIHRIQFTKEKFVTFQVFGRMLSPGSGDQYHLLWRGTNFDDEHGALSVVFSKKDLAQAPYLVGTWVGRSTWVHGSHCQPAMGAFILHNRNSLKCEELNNIMKLYKQRFPKSEAEGTFPPPWQLASEVVGVR